MFIVNSLSQLDEAIRLDVNEIVIVGKLSNEINATLCDNKPTSDSILIQTISYHLLDKYKINYNEKMNAIFLIKENKQEWGKTVNVK